MKHSEKLEVKIDKDSPISSFRKAIQYHLTDNEQVRLIDLLLKSSPEPSKIVKLFAKYFSSRKSEGGFVDASTVECWEMAKKDYEREFDKKFTPKLEGQLIDKIELLKG